MNPKNTTQIGATLVELVTWMALSSLLLAAVGGIFFSASKLWNYGNHQYDVQQAAGLVMNIITNDLRYGSSLDNKGFASDASNQVNANPNQSITFISHRDGEKKITYYLDKDNRQLYKVSNGAYATPQLVLKEMSNSGIFFVPPENEKVFDLKDVDATKHTSVTINLMVVALKGHGLPISQADINAASKNHKTFTIRTTVTLLDSFFK